MRVIDGPFGSSPFDDETREPHGKPHQGAVRAWEQLAWNSLHIALMTAPGAPSDPQVLRAMTDAAFTAAKALWTEREQFAIAAGAEASAVTAVVAQPHLRRDEAVALVLGMLHGGDPRHRKHAEELVDDAWQIGQNTHPEPRTAPASPPALPAGHLATVLPLRRS